MYKLIAVDIDGTLINDKKVLTKETKDSIDKAINQGIIFSIATGRPPIGIRNFIELFDIDFPIITFNGALVLMAKSKKIIFDQRLDYKEALKIVDNINDLDLSFIVWKENQVYTNKIDLYSEGYLNNTPAKVMMIDDIDSLLKEGVHKVLVPYTKEGIKNITKSFDDLNLINTDYYTSLPEYLEFVNKNASKGKAIEKLTLEYNINQKQTIAIGDGNNDESMIRYAGLGVAMENASDNIKQIADYITLDNNNNGVKYVIEKFVLEF